MRTSYVHPASTGRAAWTKEEAAVKTNSLTRELVSYSILLWSPNSDTHTFSPVKSCFWVFSILSAERSANRSICCILANVVLASLSWRFLRDGRGERCHLRIISTGLSVDSLRLHSIGCVVFWLSSSPVAEERLLAAEFCGRRWKGLLVPRTTLISCHSFVHSYGHGPWPCGDKGEAARSTC